MEKFSAYIDPGTGIKPFLTPVPPVGSELLARATLPLRFILGIVRTLLSLVLLSVYLILIPCVRLVLFPIPPLRRSVEHLVTFIYGRTALFVIGLFWITEEQVTRKRGRGQRRNESWNPKAGDIIVSNWASWIEVVWLALRFNPIFVLPIPEALPEPPTSARSSTPITHTPGRRTGTGSANIQPPARTTEARIPILGFQEVSLLTMIKMTGHVPAFGPGGPGSFPKSLEEIRKNASRPVVVFPECTTSNGRGLLRFANVFNQNVPVKHYQVFVMCVRYDPPTVLAPTLTLPIPSDTWNPIGHLFTLTKSLSPAQMSVRLLAPSESPSSQLFMANEVLSDYSGQDQLSETCAALIAQIGKMKRTGMGWEEKSNFLGFFRGKSR
ncbi:hypothetical protein B0H34DRAFT_689210 [Crassisporium funariophilum]|nr:hypothetical protein B0H34DRAFT_689210 [Crassisporium funariophilum]